MQAPRCALLQTRGLGYLARLCFRRSCFGLVLAVVLAMTLAFGLLVVMRSPVRTTRPVLHVHMSEENYVGKVLHGIDMSNQRVGIALQDETKQEDDPEDGEERENKKSGENEDAGEVEDKLLDAKVQKTIARQGGDDQRKKNGQQDTLSDDSQVGKRDKAKTSRVLRAKSHKNVTKTDKSAGKGGKGKPFDPSLIQPVKSLKDVNDSQTRRNWDLRRLGPFPLLPQFKNPCWYEPTRPRGACQRGPLRPLKTPKVSKLHLRCLPYFFIVGQPKAGTTDLYDRLVNHPEVARPSWKEPFWIQRHRFAPECSSLSTYLDSFDQPAKKIGKHRSGDHYDMITVDAGVDTMWDNYYWRDLPGNENCSEPCLTNADYVHMLNPKAKVIVALRDPTERAYSDYMYEYLLLDYKPDPHDFHKRVVESIYRYRQCLSVKPARFCLYDGSLENAFSVVRIRIGLYHAFLEDWWEVFGREQVHVVRFEDYASNVRGELEKIFRFLQLRPLNETEISAMLKVSVSNKRRKPELMLPETREILREFYAPFNRRLAQLLGDDGYLWAESAEPAKHTRTPI